MNFLNQIMADEKKVLKERHKEKISSFDYDLICMVWPVNPPGDISSNIRVDWTFRS